jgi:hypothetical protein
MVSIYGLGWLFNEEDLPHPRLAAGTTQLQSKPMRPLRTKTLHQRAAGARCIRGEDRGDGIAIPGLRAMLAYTKMICGTGSER